MTGRWRKVGDKWLVAVPGEVLANGTSVTVAKANGTSETQRVAHSKHCSCPSGEHVYFVARPRPKRSRAISFCAR